MSKAPIYLPISLLDVFEMIEDDKTNEIYVENGIGLVPADNLSFSLKGLKIDIFYIKQEYVSKNEQEVKDE